MFPPQVSSTQIAAQRLNAFHLFCNGCTLHVDNQFNCIHVLDNGKRCTQPIGRKRRDRALKRNFDISRMPLERLEQYMGNESRENMIINKVLSYVFCVWHHNEKDATIFMRYREKCRVWLRQEVARMRAAANDRGNSTSTGHEQATTEEAIDFENGLPNEATSNTGNVFQITAEDAWRNYNRMWHKVETWIDNSTSLAGETRWQKLGTYLGGFNVHNIQYAVPWPTRNGHPNTFNIAEAKRFYEHSIFFTKYSVAEDGQHEHISLEDIEHAREILHQEHGRWWPLASCLEEMAKMSLLYLADEHDYAIAKAILEVFKILEDTRTRITQPIFQMEIVEGQPMELPVFDFSSMRSALNDMDV